MKLSSKKPKKNYHPDVGPGGKLTSDEQFKRKRNIPNVFNKKRNPLSFVVDWQLSDKYDK